MPNCVVVLSAIALFCGRGRDLCDSRRIWCGDIVMQLATEPWFESNAICSSILLHNIIESVLSFQSVFRGPDKVSFYFYNVYFFTKSYVYHLLESSHRDDSNKWSNIGFGEEITRAKLILTTFYGSLSFTSFYITVCGGL